MHSIVWREGRLTVGEWSVPVPEHRPQQADRYGIFAVATAWEIPVTVWRFFPPDVTTAREEDAAGVLLQLENGHGLGVLIAPGTERARCGLYIGTAAGGDPANQGLRSKSRYGPTGVGHRLYWLHKNPALALQGASTKEETP